MKVALARAIIAAIVAGLICMGLWLAHLAHQREAAPARERWA